ncbi:lipase modulator protein [Collimonas arenae]|uniref:Lipase helper protein n=1 Tax=Collimonas arenae TaxID=279058 RepID=A0A0A1FF04_9BURK|nr:lipase secretion chaperone [Collimonas arenae]AIY42360.1 lipase modulator protein [Collimonas arenae]
MQTRHRFFLALVIVVAGLLAAALLWFRSPEPATATAVAGMPPDVRTISSNHVGPGRWSAAATSEPAMADTSPPPGLAVDANQHLQVNRALRDVFDYYLLGGLPGSRSEHLAQLLAYLKSGLPALAYVDGERLARAYVAYLAAHDALLERQSVPVITPDSKMAALDADRMAVWLSQLSRLRQDRLGIDVAKIWFGDEEAESQRMLAALRSGTRIGLNAGAADPVQKGFDDLRQLRQQGASQQAQHDMMAQQFGPAAAQRFDQLGQEEQAWQERYAAYRQAADQIRQQSGTAEEDRNRQIEVLRNQAFSDDAERMRAQGMDRR